MRTLGFLFVLLLVGSNSAEAQCPPNTNQTYTAPIAVGSNIEFCTMDVKTNPKVTLDNKELWQLASMSCRPVSSYNMCAFPLTQFITDYLNTTQGAHTIKLTQQTSSSDSIVNVITPARQCDYLPPNQTTPQKRPIGDIVEGNNPWPQGKRVSELENGGYEVYISAINSSQAHLIAICKGL